MTVAVIVAVVVAMTKVVFTLNIVRLRRRRRSCLQISSKL